MAYSTKTVKIESDWTLVTERASLVQFNDSMYMAITSGDTPAEGSGFLMDGGEKYVNSTNGVFLWAKAIPFKGSGVESVRIAEDT